MKHQTTLSKSMVFLPFLIVGLLLGCLFLPSCSLPGNRYDGGRLEWIVAQEGTHTRSEGDDDASTLPEPPPSLERIEATLPDPVTCAPDQLGQDKDTAERAEPDTAQRPENPAVKEGDEATVGKPCKAEGVQGTCLRVKDCLGNRKPVSGFCPGSSNIRCCVPRQNTAKSCDPSKRPQPNTQLRESPGTGGCPPGMVRVSSFCIDRYEASLVEILPSGQTRPWSPYFNPGNVAVKAVSLKSSVPQGYINGVQAANACKAAGKRLCTDMEWLRACRGPSNQTYPYGNTRRPGVCNDARQTHPAVEYFQSSANWVFGKIQHQCLNQLPNGLQKTGTLTDCVTKEGVFDMMGNLHEWTSNSGGVFRGGYYVDTRRNGNGCLYRTTAHSTAHWDYSTGFRCCASVKSP